MKRLFDMMGSLLSKKTHTHFMELGAQAFDGASWSNAEKEYGRALELAQEAKDHDAVAEISSRLGLISEHLDKLAVAETHYRRAFQTHEDSEQFEASAQCLLTLGRLYHKQHRLPDAEQVLLYAMSVYQKQFGNHSDGIADAAMCLAECYLDRQQYADAEKLLLRAVDIDELKKDRNDPQLAIKRHKLAVCYAGSNKDQEAQETFQKAVSAFDQHAFDDKGMAHKACACYHDYARFLLKQQKQSQARSMADKATALSERFPGYLDEAHLAEIAASSQV